MKQVVGATLDKVPAWSGAVAATTRSVVTRKIRREAGFEQAELWPSSSPRVSRLEAPQEVPEAAPVVDKVSFIEINQLRPVVPAPVAVAPRSAVRRVDPAPSTVFARGMPVQTIARYLNVNGAIEGMKPSGMRFDLPGRRLSQTLRLWRGTTQATAYSFAAY